MTWHIHFHHDTHHHDEAPRVGISSGSFTIPQVGETSANVWYRIHLEVTDSEGFTSEDFVDIFPLKSTLSFNTNPAGLQILLDGQPFNTPGSVLSVEGTFRTIGAPLTQSLGSEVYEFESWTHGGAQNQSITTPSADITYTANFSRLQTNFYRAINLNGPALLIDGNNWQASGTAPNFSMTGLAYANQGVTLVPPTDANRASMLRSIIWSQPSVTLSAVPAGTYDVWVYVWEDNFPATYSILLEGNVVQANYNSGSAGTWRKLGLFRATISDGTINVSLNGVQANFSGIEVWRAGPPTVTTPLVDQNATVNTLFSYTFAANTFSPSQAGNTLSYAASLENGGSLPAWLTFNASTRTFSGTPGTPEVGSVNIRVTATDAGGSVSDVFTLTVNDVTSASFYRAINLNGPALLIDGNNWQASGTAPNFSMTGLAYANQGVTLVPPTDANRASMLRSIIWSQPKRYP